MNPEHQHTWILGQIVSQFIKQLNRNTHHEKENFRFYVWEIFERNEGSPDCWISILLIFTSIAILPRDTLNNEISLDKSSLVHFQLKTYFYPESFLFQLSAFFLRLYYWCCVIYHAYNQKILKCNEHRELKVQIKWWQMWIICHAKVRNRVEKILIKIKNLLCLALS